MVGCGWGVSGEVWVVCMKWCSGGVRYEVCGGGGFWDGVVGGVVIEGGCGGVTLVGECGCNSEGVVDVA